MKKYYQGVWLVLGTAMISGVSIFLNKFGVKGIEPTLFVGLKNVLVGFLIVAVILIARDFKKIKEITIKQWVRLGLIGLLGGSLPFILFFNGLSQTSGAKAGFIHKTMFIYVAILSVLFFKEKISKKLMWGYLSLLAGLIIFLGIKPQALSWGDGLVLLATVFWSIEIIISKKLLAEISANIVVGSRMLFGGTLIWLLLLIQGKAVLVTNLSMSAWGWVAITVLFLSAYVMTFYHGLKRIPAQEATAILALGAPITLLLTTIQSGISITASQFIGIVLIVSSLLYLLRKSKSTNSYVLQEDNR